VSNIDEVETETFHLRLDILKAQCELIGLNLSLDRRRLEGHYESQTLNYLVAATKPQEENETLEMRSRDLTILARDNLEDLRAALRHSVDYRSKQAKMLYEMSNELAKIRINHDNQHKAVVDELHERISMYAERMREAVVTAKRQHQRITGEYLVLRHNARVAKELLLRNQNEAAMARRVLQEQLDRLVEESVLQRDRMEVAAQAELKIMTDDIRSAVIQKEMEVNELRRQLEAMDSSRKISTQQMRKELKKYEKKYDALQRKRQHDFKSIQDELRSMREEISRVERELCTEEVISPLTFPKRSEEDMELVTLLEQRLQYVISREGAPAPPRPPQLTYNSNASGL